MAKITNEEVKKESMAVEIILQYAFKEYGFDIPKQYSYQENGKPVASDVYFSIAHTIGAVIVAVGNNPVGIDIERKHLVKNEIARKILTKDELDYFNDNKVNEYLLDSFVRKESFFKMTGEGIGDNLTHESVIDILNTSKQVALCFDDYISIITTKEKDLYDVTKISQNDLEKLINEVNYE